jgi:hypothetical protein
MRVSKNLLTGILALCSFNSLIVAQDSTRAQQELWPGIDFHYRFNNKFRVIASYSATKLKSSDFTDGGIAFNFDYYTLPVLRKMYTPLDHSRGHFLWLRAGYAYSTSPKNSKDELKEHTLITEANGRFYLPNNFLLTNKNRMDWRFRNGSFQPRFRPRLNLERDFKTEFLTFNAYTYLEYFYNFNTGNKNRFRLAFGTEISVAHNLNFEIYLVHQFENGSQVNNVNAVGLSLKIYMEKGKPFFIKKYKPSEPKT